MIENPLQKSRKQFPSLKKYWIADYLSHFHRHLADCFGTLERI